MPTSSRQPVAPERATWWLALTGSLLAGLVWALATPLFTGPDEVSQARRAAAVVRGELTGRKERPGPPLLLTVEVPALYGDPAERNWLCHLGPLVPGTPQEAMPLPATDCPDLGADHTVEAGGDLVEAETVQYRGQPLFYAFVGVPSLLSDGVAGAYGMRVVCVAITSLLLASTAATLVGAGSGRLAALALLACVAPGTLYLAGSTNPSAVEVAAALSAWAAVGAIATVPADVVPGRLVARVGAALVALTLCRGLGPGFAAAVVLGGLVVAGPERSRRLLRRTDVRIWAGGVAAGTVASAGWLAHIGSAFPLPDRPGSGVAEALSWLPWYLRQSVGVFGTNDSAVSPLAAAVWWLAAGGVFAAGLVRLLRRGGGPHVRQAIVAVLALLGGATLNVTAEGLSLPPIGFFWQGRYALPLLLGGIVLAVLGPRPADATAEGGGTSPSPVAVAGVSAGAAALLAVHAHAQWVVAEHHGSPSGAVLVAVVCLYSAAVALMAFGPAMSTRVGCRCREDLRT